MSKIQYFIILICISTSLTFLYLHFTDVITDLSIPHAMSVLVLGVIGFLFLINYDSTVYNLRYWSWRFLLIWGCFVFGLGVSVLVTALTTLQYVCAFILLGTGLNYLYFSKKNYKKKINLKQNY